MHSSRGDIHLRSFMSGDAIHMEENICNLVQEITLMAIIVLTVQALICMHAHDKEPILFSVGLLLRQGLKLLESCLKAKKYDQQEAPRVMA